MLRDWLRRLEILVLLLLLAGVYAVIVAPLVQGQLYASVDHNAFTIPLRLDWAAAIQRGDTGMWCGHEWRGFSLLGKGEAGTLHPLQWLAFRWLPVDVALRLWQGITMPLLVLGVWWLLQRVYRLEARAALLGAAAAAVSVFFLAHFGMTHMTLILAHAPWVLVALERCLAPGWQQWRGAATLALLVASMFLLGHPQMVWFVALLCAFVVVDRGLERRGDAVWRSGLWHAVLGAAAGLLIGLAQLLPTFAELQDNPRGQLNALARGNFSAHPLHLLQNLAPYFFTTGPLDVANQPGDRFDAGEREAFYLRNPSDFSVYFGVALLTLIYGGLVLQRRALLDPARRKRQWLWVIAGVLLLLLMLGRYGLLNELLGQVPGIGAFTSPNRHKVLLGLLLAGLAAIVWQALLLAPPRWPTRREWAWLLLPPLLCTLPALAGRLLLQVPFAGRQLAVDHTWWLAYGPLVALAAVLLLAVALRGSALARTALALLCVLDLAAFGLPIVRQVPYKSVDEVRQAFIRVQSPVSTRLFFDNVGDFWEYGEPWWLGQAQVTGFLGTLVPVEQLDYAQLAHLRLASVATALDGKTHQAHAVPDPLPRARLVPTLRHAEAPLAAATASGVDLAQVAFCTPQEAAEITGPPLAPDETVTVVRDTGDRLELAVHLSAPRLLVLSDRYAPGWRARVTRPAMVDREPWWLRPYDFHPRPDPTARRVGPVYGGMLRAVWLQPTDETVVLTYDPLPAAIGRHAACLGLALVLLFILFHRRAGDQRPWGY